MAETLQDSRERVEIEQQRQKLYSDKHRRSAPVYEPGSLVLLKTHLLSQASKGNISKFSTKRDGPYRIRSELTPNTFEIEEVQTPHRMVGRYHTSDLTTFVGTKHSTQPTYPKRARGRPRKQLLH